MGSVTNQPLCFIYGQQVASIEMSTVVDLQETPQTYCTGFKYISRTNPVTESWGHSYAY